MGPAGNAALESASLPSQLHLTGRKFQGHQHRVQGGRGWDHKGKGKKGKRKLKRRRERGRECEREGKGDGEGEERNGKMRRRKRRRRGKEGKGKVGKLAHSVSNRA